MRKMSEYFTESHEWVRLEDDNIGLIGLTNYAQAELGDIVFVDLPTVGKHVAINDPIAVIESVKVASDINAPISGTIIAVNERLSSAPQLVNESPDTNGWLLRIKLDHPAQLEALMNKDTYNALITNIVGE